MGHPEICGSLKRNDKTDNDKDEDKSRSSAYGEG
jgi:hypothetical protein